MDDSLDVVRRHREAGTLHNEQKKIADVVLRELGERRLLGPARRSRIRRQRHAVLAFAPFLTRMAMIDPTVAGLASVHGCIGAVDPVRTFGTPEQKQRFLPGLASGERLSALRPDRAVRRLRPDRPAHHGRRSTATTTSSTARSCSSPTSSPAARSAWSA